MPDHALKGVRVLAMEQAAAGPFATHLLADMGAEVIKIERPGSGDVIRSWDRDVKGLSSGFVWLNRAKRSITVNPKTPGGREILARIADRSDVFLTNFAAGVADKFGLGYEALAKRNPRIVYCALTGYGLTGPYRDVKAYDLLIQGEAALLATTGYPDAPAKVSAPISDLAAGMYAALGISMALFQRERTGRGQLIDVSMFESILSWLGYFPQQYWHTGKEAQRQGMRHAFMVPYGPYLAKDGQYVNIAVASGRNWELFCRHVVDRPEWIEDERFIDSPARNKNRGILEKMIEDLFLEHDADYWLARLKAVNLPYGEVRGIASVLAHPQVAARNLIREIDSPIGRLPTVEGALRLSDSPPAEGPLPGLGADTEDVLRESGFSEEEIRGFREAGAI